MTQSQTAKTQRDVYLCTFKRNKAECSVCVCVHTCTRLSCCVELRCEADQGFAPGRFQFGEVHWGGCGGCEGLVCGVCGQAGDD